MSDELAEFDWQGMVDEANAKGGRYRIALGGEPKPYMHEADCPDCGKHLRASGVAFGDHEHLTVNLHWSEDCPAWKHRRRLLHVHLPRLRLTVRHPRRALYYRKKGLW